MLKYIGDGDTGFFISGTYGDVGIHRDVIELLKVHKLKDFRHKGVGVALDLRDVEKSRSVYERTVCFVMKAGRVFNVLVVPPSSASDDEFLVTVTMDDYFEAGYKVRAVRITQRQLDSFLRLYDEGAS